MKRSSFFVNLLLLAFSLIPVSVFPQERVKGAIIGTVTITESGQVIVQPFTETATKPENGITYTSGLPQKFIEQKAGVKPAVKTEISVTDPESFEKSFPTVSLGTTTVSSTDGAVRMADDSGPAEPLERTGNSTASTRDIQAQAVNLEFDFLPNASVYNYAKAYLDDSPATGKAVAPNLTLQAGSANCTVTETSINLSFTVINNGTASAGASEVGYYLSQDVSITTTPNYAIGTDPVAALAVGSTSTETHSVNVAAMSVPCGTYYIFFCIDHLYQVEESNENDNDWYFPAKPVTIPCVPNLDLATSSSSISVAGTNVTIGLSVINNGSSVAGASELGYYLSPDVSLTTTPNYLIGTDAVPSLAVGGTSAETYTGDVSLQSIPCGTYYVIFKIDRLDQVTESNENDNVWYFSSPKVPIPCLPNLDLSSGTASLSVNGTMVSIGLTVENNGEAAAGVSELGYYLSPDVMLTTTPNYLIGTDGVTALAIGGVSAESISVNVSAMSIPCGTYYVIFSIDHNKEVAENNENDNTYYWSTPTVIIPCVPNLDLASGSSSFSVDGTNINLALTVINNGSVAADASVLGYYLSPDASIATVPNYLIGTDAIPELEIGATSAQTLAVDVSASSVPCGTYYVFFYFDYLGQVTESNETDNIWYFTSPQVTIPCAPNLDLVLNTSNLIVNGTIVSVDLSVINNGSTGAGASEVGFYLSQDVSLTTEPNYLIGTDAVPALEIGAKSTVSITEVDVAEMSIPEGTYYVFFFIDHLKQVAESNEIDNIWYFTSQQVTITEITGVAATDLPDAVFLYPNPAGALINIDLHNLSVIGSATLNIYDIHGQLVMTRKVIQPKFSLEIKGLASGVYFLNIYGERMNKTVRFIKE